MTYKNAKTLSGIPYKFVTKTEITPNSTAMPSTLTVAPSGSVNPKAFSGMPKFSLATFIDTGKVALLDVVLAATKCAGDFHAFLPTKKPPNIIIRRSIAVAITRIFALGLTLV